jgi:hypothetical protein
LAGSRRGRKDHQSHTTPEPSPSPQETQSQVDGQRSKTWILVAATSVAVIVFVCGMSWQLLSGRNARPVFPPMPSCPSRSSAAKPAQAAMRRRQNFGAHPSTISPWLTRPDNRCLAIFSAAHSPITACSRFFREGSKFLVETDGPDGKLAVFEIKYTFGVYPLQQYLIEFPDGRLQALGVAWDSRPKDAGRSVSIQMRRVAMTIFCIGRS